MFSSSSIFTLPQGALTPSLAVSNEATLLSIDKQEVTASRGQTVSFTATYNVAAGANPSQITQAFFAVSWTPSWPPPSGYFISMYDGIPGLAPGVTETRIFSINVPTTPGTYYIWFLMGSYYNMQDAVNAFTAAPSLPAHIKIVVSSESTVRAWKDGAEFGLENDRILAHGSSSAYIYPWGWDYLIFKDTGTRWGLPWNELSAGASVGLGTNAYGASSFDIQAFNEPNKSYIKYDVIKDNFRWEQTYTIYAGKPYIYETVRITNLDASSRTVDLGAAYITYIAGDTANDYYYFPMVGQRQFTGATRDQDYSAGVEGWAAVWDASKGEGAGLLTTMTPSSFRSYDWYGVCACGEGVIINLPTSILASGQTSQTYDAYLYFFTGTGPDQVRTFYDSVRPAQPPGPPVEFGVAAGDGEVSLAWSTPALGIISDPDVTGYQLYRGPTPEQTVLLTSFEGGGSFSYQDNTVTNDVTFCYRVSALAGSVEGNSTAAKCVTPRSFGPTLVKLEAGEYTSSSIPYPRDPIIPVARNGDFLEFTLNLPSTGDFVLMVYGKDDSPGPIVVDITVDGVPSGSLSFPADDDEFRERAFDLPQLSGGTHRIRLTFVNDYSVQQGVDRNFYLRWIRIPADLITVSLVSPPNGAEVSTSPVELTALVRSGGVAIDGAAVSFYVNGSQVGAAVSDSSGYASYNYSPPSAGTYRWNVTAAKAGYDSGASPTYSFNYTVMQEPPFNWWFDQPSPPSQTVLAGDSTTFSITARLVSGDPEVAFLSLSGLPDSVGRGSFIPESGSLSLTSTLTIVTLSTAPAGRYDLTVFGVAGGVPRSTSVTLVVVGPDFSLKVFPETVEIYSSEAANYQITVDPLYGWREPVALTVSGLPSDAGYFFSRNPVNQNGWVSTLTVTPGSETGKFTLNITGIGGGKDRQDQVELVITPPPPISVTYSPSNPTTIDIVAFNITVWDERGELASLRFRVDGKDVASWGINGRSALKKYEGQFSAGLHNYTVILYTRVDQYTLDGSFTVTQAWALTISTSPELRGVQFRIDGEDYYTDTDGVIRVDLAAGTHEVEVVTPYYSESGTRYSFVRFSFPASSTEPTASTKVEIGLFSPRYILAEFKEEEYPVIYSITLDPPSVVGRGETLRVSVTVENTTASPQDLLIAIQILSPQLEPLPTLYVSVTLDPGQSFTFSPSVVIPQDAVEGTWKASVMLLSDFPSKGGRVVAKPREISFIVIEERR